MKFAIPEISWHNRDPVLSIDFQPQTESNGPLRLATGGTDSHVLIWYLNTSDSGSVNIEVVADLTRHQKAVNVVRWSPNGQLLASGDDESIIFIWQQKSEKETVQTLDQGEEQYKETWVIHKTLRGHMEDVLDLSWSADSLQLASGSVDNKLLVWDVARGRYTSIITDHKGFIQGVSWDPQGSLIATVSTDRVFRTFDVNTKKVVSRSSKATLPFPPDHPLHDVKVRLYHDDTLQTYFRRLDFSPDGLLLAVPAGRIEPDQAKADIKPINAVYIYTRYSLKVPACVLPTGEAALVARWSPVRYAARPTGPSPAFPGARLVLAVATKRSVLLYDTQQKTPIALISNIHYTRLTGLSWSGDGRRLVASSTDGYCSVISFDDELGDPLPAAAAPATAPATAPAPGTAVPMEVEEQEQKDSPKTDTIKEKAVEEKPSNVQKIDSFIKFKTPSQKSPKKQKIDTKQQKTPIKIDLLEEAAMPSWNDNSNSDVIKPKHGEAMDVDSDRPSAVIEIEDSEDMKLVYDETETKSAESQSPKDLNTVSPEQKKASPKEDKNVTPDKKESTEQKISPKVQKSPEKKNESPKAVTPKSSNFFKQAKVTDVKSPASSKAAPSPKAPRRVSFVTLSSPKNTKKK